MNFVIDENIPLRVADFLKERNHEIIDFRNSDKEGSDDKVTFSIACEMNAFFLTTDKDFFHTIPFLFKDHPGIIVISLRQPNGRAILEKVRWLIDNIDLYSIRSKVILLRDNSYKIYS